MAFLILCGKICATRKLMNTNLVKKCLSTINANVRNIKKDTILRNKSTVSVIPKRNFFGPFKKHTKDQMRVIDNVPDNYMLIYRNTMDRYLLLAQVFSSVTAFIVILMFIITHDFPKSELDLSKWDNPARATNNELYVYITAFIGFVVIMQVMVSRLPIRIYYLPQQKKYKFIFYGNYPFTRKELSCKIGEVYPLPEKGISPWKEARYNFKGEQKIILLDQYFRRPADLYIMLGVQRDHEVNEEK